jgi:hypothetical protein
MKNAIKIGIIGALLALGAVTQSNAQQVVQNLSINLTAYSSTNGTTVRAFHITTRDVIRYFVGTNVPNGHLLLVSPAGPPITSDNLGVFLRITQGTETVLEVPSPDSFNIFQDSSTATIAGSRITTRASNRFSIDFGGFHAELQGFTTWNASSQTPGGQGSFSSSVNGWSTVDDVTQALSPTKGTISGSAARLAP